MQSRESGPGEWGPQGMAPTGGGGQARVPRVCKTPFCSVAHARREGSRRGKVPPVRCTDAGAKNRAARKGKWSPRGTAMTVLTYPCRTASHVSVAVRVCARVTSNVGENGQKTGEMGGSSPWTRLSACGCGDTSKVLASCGSTQGEDWATWPWCQQVLRPPSSSVAVRDRGHRKSVCGKRMGPLNVAELQQ